MKIVHVATAQTWRGGEQQVAYLTESLVGMEVEQTVMCAKGSAMEAYCREHNITYFSYAKRSALDPFAAQTLKQLTNAFLPDLIHLHDAHAHTMAWLSAVFFGNKTPLILSRRVDFPVKNNWMSLRKYNHPNIKRIVCVSKMIQQITAPSISDPSKLCTVYSGIDLNRFANLPKERNLHTEYGLKEDQILVGNTSAIADHKDYFTFVDTAEKLLDISNRYAFFIIGKGPDQAKVERYIQQKGLSEKIMLTGFRKNVLSLLNELDVFLMTSKTEGLGTSLIDAMACGVPIVSTAAGGIPELIVNESTGLLSAIGNATELATQLHRLQNDEVLKQQLILAAKEKAHTFSKEKTAQETHAIYLSVLAESTRSGEEKR
jgi:glycosyltransferase involved in cell wall biosynthesis